MKRFSFSPSTTPNLSKEFNMKSVLSAIALTVASMQILAAQSDTGANNSDIEVLSEQDTHIIAATGNFESGHCTFYADQMIRKNWSGYAKGTTWQGDAKDWLKNAKAKGLATSSKPSMHAIAVYGPTTKNKYGHVAVVVGVKNGEYVVSEMNYTGLGKITTRTLSNSADRILGFIPKPVQMRTPAQAFLPNLSRIVN